MRAMVLVIVMACGAPSAAPDAATPFVLDAKVTWTEAFEPGTVTLNGMTIESGDIVERTYGSFAAAASADPLVIIVSTISGAAVALQPTQACGTCAPKTYYVSETDTWELTSSAGSLFLSTIEGSCAVPNGGGCGWTFFR